MRRTGSLQFFGKLRRCFDSHFLCFLGLTYFGLKGIAATLIDSSLLPYFQRMNISGSHFQLATMVAQIPWSMKGFVGVLSDCLPIGRFHKRGYLLLSSVVGVAGLAALATLPLHKMSSSAAWPVASLFCSTYLLVSTFDLLCEGKYSELMREESGGPEVLTLVWACVQLGSLAASFLVGMLIDSEGPQPMLLACLPLALAAAWRTLAGDLPEQPARSWKSLRLKAQSEPGLFLLAMAMAGGSLAVAVATALLGRAGRTAISLAVSGTLIACSFRTLPRTIARCNLYMFAISVAYLDLTGPLAYFYTGGPGCVENGPNFSYSYYLAVANIVGSAGSAFGAVMFQYMQHWWFRAAFCLTTGVQVLASASDLLIVSRLNIRLGLPDKAFYLLGDAACQNIAQQMATMPMALLTARLCPRGAEATVFAILAGFQNFGAAVSSILGVHLTEAFGVKASAGGPCNFEGLCTLIVVSHFVIPLACLPLAWCLVPAVRMDDEQAFAAAPLPSFSSPAPSVATSPLSSPRLSLSAAVSGSPWAGPTAASEPLHLPSAHVYHLMQDATCEGSGFLLRVQMEASAAPS